MKTKKITKEKNFDYATIKSFEDACQKLGIDSTLLPSIPLDEFTKPIVASYKLMIIYKAINNGWKPNWCDSNQYKYYPWFDLSSGFGFAASSFVYDYSITAVGSHLCTDTLEKALYIAKQFEAEYNDYFLYSE